MHIDTSNPRENRNKQQTNRDRIQSSSHFEIHEIVCSQSIKKIHQRKVNIVFDNKTNEFSINKEFLSRCLPPNHSKLISYYRKSIIIFQLSSWTQNKFSVIISSHASMKHPETLTSKESWFPKRVNETSDDLTSTQTKSIKFTAITSGFPSLVFFSFL